MGIHNGFAKRQAKSQASAAIHHFIRAAVEHIKDTWLLVIRDARPIVGYGHRNPLVPTLCVNFNLRTIGCIFNGIVHKVDNYLNNQPCINLSQNQVLGAADLDDMMLSSAVDMAQGLSNDIVHQLHR